MLNTDTPITESNILGAVHFVVENKSKKVIALEGRHNKILLLLSIASNKVYSYIVRPISIKSYHNFINRLFYLVRYLLLRL